MDNLFSVELKELVSKSRETAIDLGYGYISTIHFFIADCESKASDSILKFGFNSDSEFEKFKRNHTLKKDDLLNYIDESLPLTQEAVITIRLAETERMLCKQKLVYPSHFFLAALKNKESILFECFKQDENAYDNLVSYYNEFNEFEKSKMTEKEIEQQYHIPKVDNGNGILNRIFQLFRPGKQ